MEPPPWTLDNLDMGWAKLRGTYSALSCDIKGTLNKLASMFGILICTLLNCCKGGTVCMQCICMKYILQQVCGLLFCCIMLYGCEIYTQNYSNKLSCRDISYYDVLQRKEPWKTFERNLFKS